MMPRAICGKKSFWINRNRSNRIFRLMDFQEFTMHFESPWGLQFIVSKILGHHKQGWPRNLHFKLFVVVIKLIKGITAWKVSIFGVFLVLIFRHLDWIRKDMEYLSVFSPKTGKYGPEKLRIPTFFARRIFCNFHSFICYFHFSNKDKRRRVMLCYTFACDDILTYLLIYYLFVYLFSQTFLNIVHKRVNCNDSVFFAQYPSLYTAQKIKFSIKDFLSKCD